MPIIKNTLRRGQQKYQGLENFDVFIEETEALGAGLAVSKYFNVTNFPTRLPLGNSFFSFEGSDLLKPGVELKIEIVDSNNYPIFYYPLRKPITQRQVDVSMELYSGVTSGIGKLIMLGELDPTKTNVPEEFQGMYNVRFIGNIVIDTTIPNTEPIRFFKVPRLTVKEDVRPNIILPAKDDVFETILTGVGDFFGGGNSGLDVADTDDGGDGGSGLGTGGGDDDLDINTDRDENDWQDTKGGLKG